MGKEGKKKQQQRHDPLHMEILKADNPYYEEDTSSPIAKAAVKAKKVRSNVKTLKTQPTDAASATTSKLQKPAKSDEDEDEDMGVAFVDTKTTKRVLDMVRDQQEEVEMEERQDGQSSKAR
jgi:hypothetical protein